jgi:hypothetical protein
VLFITNEKVALHDLSARLTPGHAGISSGKFSSGQSQGQSSAFDFGECLGDDARI